MSFGRRCHERDSVWLTININNNSNLVIYVYIYIFIYNGVNSTLYYSRYRKDTNTTKYNFPQKY